MNGQELSQAWQQVCLHIKQYDSVDSSQVEAFFSRIKPQAMSSDFLMLTADNDFIRNWISTHYLTVIKKALNEIYNTNFSVLIEVDPNQADKSQNTPAAPAPIKENHPQASPSIPSANAPREDTPALKDTTLKGRETQIQTPSPIPSPHQAPTQRGQQATQQTTDDIFSPLSSFTFENFVIGDSNRMAYSMAVAVAEMPGKDNHNNPLFIYGKSGLGKTHLLRAIQNYIQDNLPELSVIYVDSAELLSDYMEASVAHDKEKASYKNFKTRYEEANVLLIDDVQYLQGKKQTLDIVFQIFNKLISKGSQVVLSADRAPKNIDIDERYQSRFNSGATIDIQPPEIETKLGIVKGYLEDYYEREGNSALVIPNDVQMYIAECSGSNVRELKSAVTKVISHMTFFGQPNMDIQEAKQILENHFSGGATTRLTISDIQKAVESFYKISHSDLVGKKRTREIAYARQVGIYLCRQMLDLPFNDIGKQFNKDHSTAMHAVTNIETKMKENRELREELELLRRNILES